MEWYKQGMGEETDEDLAMNFQMWLVAFCDEMKQTSVTDIILKDKGTGTITVYDYNDDTRVYILENVVEDKIFVIYLYHEQDY